MDETAKEIFGSNSKTCDFRLKREQRKQEADQKHFLESKAVGLIMLDSFVVSRPSSMNCSPERS